MLLKECITIYNGKDYSHLGAGDIPVYGTGGVFAYVNDCLYDGDALLLPRKGSLNNVLFTAGEKFWTVDTMFYAVSKNPDINLQYIYYYLTLLDLTKLDVGSTVPSMTTTLYYQLDIPTPSRETQDKIVDILSGIDNQIERNNDMVKKLQVLAHTTYQRWFEQFEFPNEHGKPYKSSGGKMVWNDELKREIPDTWNSSTLGASIIECPKSSLQVNAASMTPDGYPFFTSGDNVLIHNEWIVDGAHCFLNTGGNADVKFWLGKAAYSTDTWCIHFGQFTFLYYEYLQDLKQHMDRLFFAGSGLKHLQKDILRQRNVLLPPQKILNAYNYIASSCYQQIGVLLAENNNLSNLKTKLLPLLMNGQLCA